MKKQRMFAREHKPPAPKLNGHFHDPQEYQRGQLPPEFSLLAENIEEESAQAEHRKKEDKPLDPKTFSHLEEKIDEKESEEASEMAREGAGQAAGPAEAAPGLPPKQQAADPEVDEEKMKSPENEAPVLKPGTFSQLEERIQEPMMSDKHPQGDG